MEKKFKFSENPTAAKRVYGAVIALLCIGAIVVGIIAANNRKKPETETPIPPVTDGTEGGEGTQDGGNNEEDAKGDAVTYISPVSGSILKWHSDDVPVFSETLGAWKIHTGIDIMTDEGAEVFSAADGVVSRIYSDPMLGNTVEITHQDGSKTLYSNLSDTGLVANGTEVKQGAKIGVVGDSAISELADEAHLHFELLVDGKSVNPLDRISEESKKTSLGIGEGEEA